MCSCRHNPASRRHVLANDTKQGLILVWLDEIFRGAHLKSLVPMLLASPRGQHDNRNIAVRRVPSQGGGEFIPIHPRHLDVQQDQRWWGSGALYDLERFEPILG